MSKRKKQNPLIIEYHNPLDLRERSVIQVMPRTKFVTWLTEKYPRGFKKPYIVLYNSVILEVENFDVLLLENDILELKFNVQDPITITIIAISAIVSVVAAIVVINTLNSLPDPTVPSSFEEVQSSPNYNLRKQSNTARIGEPIPIQYGKLRVFPDLAASPWTEYIDNELFLNQIFTLGWGEFEIDDIRLGEISLDTLSGVTFTITEPGSPVNAFHDNMYTSPFLKSLELLNNRTLFNQSDQYDFLKSLSKVVGPAGSAFDFFLAAGDTVVLAKVVPTSSDGFEGEYTVSSVTDTEIILTDVSAWPGDDLNPDFYDIVQGREVSRIGTNTSIDVREPYETDFFDIGWSRGYITSPIGDNAEELLFDIELPDGLFDTAVDLPAKVLVTLLLRELDQEGNFKFLIHDLPSVPVSGLDVLGVYPGTSNKKWGASNSEVIYGGDNITYAAFSWVDDGSLEFFENGVPIPPGDIATIKYGDETGGAFVEFTTSKTAPITIEGNVKNYAETSKELNNVFILEGRKNESIRKTFSIVLPKADPPGTDVPQSRFIVYFKGALLDGNGQGVTFSNALNVTGKTLITGMKAKLPKVENYGPYTFLSTTIKATGDIDASNSKKFNVIATRKLLQWNGSAWTGPAATRSIAWAFADAWMSTYGANRPVSGVDLAQLLTLDALWTSRGDTFDGVFDQRITDKEALEKILRVGRAKPVEIGDSVNIVRDEEKTIHTTLFNSSNIINGTFKINYSFDTEDSPDGVKVIYRDEEKNYQRGEVLSDQDSTQPREISLEFGVVNYDQAWKESQYLAATLKANKRLISFETELDGHIPLVGDLVLVTAELPTKGQGGEVTNKIGTAISTSEPLDFTGTAPFKISFRKENGAVSGPHTVTQGVGTNEALLSVDVTDFTFITERGIKERTYYTFGPTNLFSQECLITAITPIETVRVGIDCIPYNPEIYLADTGTIPPKPPDTSSTVPIPPKVGGILLENDTDSGIVDASWNVTEGIDNYKVQKSTDRTSWVDVSTPTVTFETIAATGLLYVRVAGVISGNVGEYNTKNIVSS